MQWLQCILHKEIDIDHVIFHLGIINENLCTKKQNCENYYTCLRFGYLSFQLQFYVNRVFSLKFIQVHLHWMEMSHFQNKYNIMDMVGYCSRHETLNNEHRVKSNHIPMQCRDIAMDHHSSNLCKWGNQESCLHFK